MLLAAILIGVAAIAAWAGARVSASRRANVPTSIATHIDRQHGRATGPKFTPVKSTALLRGAQEVYESKEATRDRAVLEQLLRDIRDLCGADETIFWRWVEDREMLVPAAWSTEREPKPTQFDMGAWGALVRWSAEQAIVQLDGESSPAPKLATAPVLGPASVLGVLTATSRKGLQLDREAARSWMPRYAAQLASLVQLFDVRREYGRHMRQSGALLDAVQKLHVHRNAEGLTQALCDTARDVTSAHAAGLIRWNEKDQHGVVQSVTSNMDLEPGFHVTPESMAGRVCIERLPLLLEDAASATRDACPFGGLPRPIGSVAIVPVTSADDVIGAIIVEGAEAGDISQHEARNVGLLAAVARGSLEIAWEVEEVSKRARTDVLTGLANRRHFDEQLRRVAAETDRFGGTCSLILLDLDHFKEVNDRYGHDGGDAALKHVAQVLSDAVRTVDLCARYGGEEIVILLPQTSAQGAVELAERLRQTIASRPATSSGQRISITASFGVASYPTPVPYGDWLVLAADKALYEAKAAGRNCVKMIHANNVTPALYKMR
ncbi:MAG TPA: sensor domain-containing diguanylate cyclase [Gemmatimonadaceae bacterium]